MERVTVEIAPLVRPVSATLALPGSKSEANRALAAAALSGARVEIHHATPCDDVVRMVDGLAAMGYGARFLDRSRGHVLVEPRGDGAPTEGEIFCGNAGTALRFLVSVAALTPGRWCVTGDAHMQRRPIGALVDAWSRLGLGIDAPTSCPPVHVTGGTLGPGPHRVELDPSLSSQYVSSLLLAGSALAEPLELVFTAPPASIEYARLTCDLLGAFGVRAQVDADGARVEPRRAAAPARFDVGGDWSAMGAFTCLEHLTGSRVHATNLRRASGQSDEGLGAVLDAFAQASPRTIDVSSVPDQFMNLAVVAAANRGTTRFVGAANLRVKECDRLAVTARELAKLGVTTREHEDGLEVDGVRALGPATIDPESDHRIAMAFALAGLLAPGVVIGEPACVAKSYPAFFEDLDHLRASPANLVLVGMRGSGKSTLAAALGERWGCEVIDTDRLFEREHGAIGAFVESQGWGAFRREEARLFRSSLAGNGRVLALGGGAIETDEVRGLLRHEPCVVHVVAPAHVLRERLDPDDPARPSLTGADVRDELAALLERRIPLYDEVAGLAADGTADARDEAQRLVDALAARCTWPGARAC